MRKTSTTLFTLASGMTLVMLHKPLELPHFHSDKEREILKRELRAAGPHATNSYFAGSGLCGGCHGHDPLAYALITAGGEDVNIYDDWAGTMMANSAKDPFWRAKVSHEILVNPAYQTEIETACTSCHAPIGHFTAMYHGASSYPVAALDTDSLARDGVNCGACHQQYDTLIGKRFSGNLIYDTTKTVYGQYPAPFSGPMESFIGFKVTRGPHIQKAGLCAGCHTLITNAHDTSGIPTGTDFIEQATYHEWLNSSFNNETFPATGRTCQSCHIPAINENIVIAANFAFLSPRRPFGKHHLVGANAFMLDILKNNISALGVTALPSHFDTTINRTKRILQDSTVTMSLNLTSRTPDTAFYDLDITNLAGHKFPSGYPSRRSFIQFVVLDDLGDTLFKNGMLDGANQIIGQDATFEPHHNMINNVNDVQIYELVAGDVNGNVTTVLERAFVALKDNRLVPKGFSTSHYAYDTTKIIGEAASDTDFNHVSATEGSGSDAIHFHVPLGGYGGGLNIVATLYYQSVPRRWLDEMFMFTSPEITAFQGMFNAADHTPLVVSQIKTGSLFLNVYSPPTITQVSVYPNPSATGQFKIKSSVPVDELAVYNLQGELVLSLAQRDDFTLQRRETYIVRIRAGKKVYTEKIIFH